MAPKVSASRIGFMLCCFLMPCLAGVFASFSIPAPLVDLQHQQAALEAVASNPALAAGLAGLVDADTAQIVTQGPGTLAQRLAAAKQHMAVEELAEARQEAYRIRLMVITMGLFGAVFGVMLMGPDKK